MIEDILLLILWIGGVNLALLVSLALVTAFRKVRELPSRRVRVKRHF